MKRFNLVFKLLICISILLTSIPVCLGGELSESKSFFDFIRAVDPKNLLRIGWENGLVPILCSTKLKGVKCNLQASTIIEIKLENMNLSGTIDADSLCKLKNLQVLSLAKNRIRGSIPSSISNCRKLMFLDLSNNLLSGKVPTALTKLKNLKTLDISNNQLSITPHLKEEFKKKTSWEANGVNGSRLNSRSNSTNELESTHKSSQPPNNGNSNSRREKWYEKWASWLPLVSGTGFLFLFGYLLNKKAVKLARDREILKSLRDESPPVVAPQAKHIEEKLPDERPSNLVFFVEEHERFKLEDLLEAGADLQSQSIYSSLYKVMLKNKEVYAVKRLKKLQVSSEEFHRAMMQIGNLKHPNILPLVGYNSTNEEKLLIYKYQNNGSLLDLLENYIDGKRKFPWRIRLSIASGIARGLDFIYQKSNSIPHGNLKLSNIMLDENEEPLISEYGISKLFDLKRGGLFPTNGHAAPEKTLTEQADVYSFGVILLELLTGKIVEKSGIDLPKWVRAMVREEWTGEVFDKEVNKEAKQSAFSLLKISLKCVSLSPENRPGMAEVMEKIEEVANSVLEDYSVSSMSSMESCHQDCCLLHTVIPETWETPGPNY